MLKDLKPALGILFRFILIYFVLFIGYQWYLKSTEVGGLDPYSRWVAGQVNTVQEFLGYPSHTEHFPQWSTEYFYINHQAVTRMVEGCNAISVMMLCIAFVFAFYQGGKTWWYAVGSICFLHVINVLRIAGINLIYVEYEAYSEPAHDYLFPVVIYGSVVGIWLVWMKMVNKNTK
ncbi:exosortase family protein XrtF [Bergeyella zoohelcum]|uniref:Exosortase family protein XrtF n=1 Tax=Bergeyella zoohelcum ATCC 43767 TaxID=883096 RepID=K1LPI3_9FLAO|nr:exosortase family protein XrtF [Bergeyella zoohelcum]EKB58845.1 hypothetical protein HMPREF9699_00476 [Bergeyella zoohelcum ATCC 43767]SUV49335.1 exosortase family protein XrtF [Bergeyella zoohelcum]